MATKTIDPAALAADAAAKAASVAPRASQASNYKELAGPFEVPGGAADAFITESPSGLSYLESRPRNGGRVKRVPLATVGAVFPQVLPPAE